MTSGSLRNINKHLDMSVKMDYPEGVGMDEATPSTKLCQCRVKEEDVIIIIVEIKHDVTTQPLR